MPLVPVVTYTAGWNLASKQGKLFIRGNVGQAQEVRVASQEEFLIMLLMLSKNGVMFDTATNDIEFAFRPTGT